MTAMRAWTAITDLGHVEHGLAAHRAGKDSLLNHVCEADVVNQVTALEHLWGHTGSVDVFQADWTRPRGGFSQALAGTEEASKQYAIMKWSKHLRTVQLA